MQYNLDVKAAKLANAGGRIEQTGQYDLTIVRAELIKAKNTQSDGVEFVCKTSAGESVQFTLWTISGKTGEQIGGYNQLMSIMTCCGVRTLTPTNAVVNKWDYTAKENTDQSVLIAPELAGKRIGCFMERENYHDNDGVARHQMNLFAAFNPENNMTADEILDKKTSGTMVDKIAARLAARPEQWRKQKGGQARPATQSMPTVLDDDLDLPF